MKGTIEQIDYLREKVGLTYEEAVSMLDKHEGDLAKCMVELERMGRVRTMGQAAGRGFHGDARRHRGAAFVMDWEGIKRVLFSRIRVSKDERIVTNLTALSWIFVLFAAPWVLLIGVIATFVTGCKIKWDRGAAEPNLDIHALVGQAADNIRRTTESVVSAVKSEDSPIHGEGDKQDEGNGNS